MKIGEYINYILRISNWNNKAHLKPRYNLNMISESTIGNWILKKYFLKSVNYISRIPNWNKKAHLKRLYNLKMISESTIKTY